MHSGVATRSRQSPGLVAGRIVAAVVGCSAALLWLLMALLVFDSRFGNDPSSDPHGFGIIFGALLAAPIALVSVATLPFAFPKPRWGRAFAVVVPLFAIGTLLLFVALFTAP